MVKTTWIFADKTTKLLETESFPQNQCAPDYNRLSLLSIDAQFFLHRQKK